MNIGRGEQYQLPIMITALNGGAIDMTDATEVEFTFGSITKSWLNDDSGPVTYNPATNLFSFPLTQSDTLGLSGVITGQARVKWVVGGDTIVRTTDIYHISIRDCLQSTPL